MTANVFLLYSHGRKVNIITNSEGFFPLFVLIRKGKAPMKKLIIACILSLGLSTLGAAQEPATNSRHLQTFKAGGIPIIIPPPIMEMSEVGYDKREFMEVFVAPSNRLIAAFVLTKELPTLAAGANNPMLSKYAMIQVPRRGEYMDCRESDFKEVTDGAKKTFGDVMSSSMKDAEDEFNRRMKSLDLEEATISLNKPIQLGCLFSKKDAYGFGMIMPFSMGGENMKIAMGATLMRVKQRLLFVYLYADYKDENTVKWLRRITENWADAILKANK